ncbi:hypothetical protein XENOCAPTIV_013129 [Xenoophorus captivus]|uniref:Uncharacterized protein n=1 Tax=Xenoophorus captivus TaxID=1517983 RepID=A0ABV0R8S0_9TELE
MSWHKCAQSGCKLGQLLNVNINCIKYRVIIAVSSIVFQSHSQAETGADSSAKGPPDTQLRRALVSRPDCQTVCPKTVQRMPENYVPCVFLGQGEHRSSSKCPAMGWDRSAMLDKESCRSSIELNNNSYIDKEHQQRAEIHTRRPSKDVGVLKWKCEVRFFVFLEQNINKNLILLCLVPLYVQVQFHLMLYIQMQLCERSLKDWISERNSRPKEEQISGCNCLKRFSILLQGRVVPLQTQCPHI